MRGSILILLLFPLSAVADHCVQANKVRAVKQRKVVVNKQQKRLKTFQKFDDFQLSLPRYFQPQRYDHSDEVSELRDAVKELTATVKSLTAGDRDTGVQFGVGTPDLLKPLPEQGPKIVFESRQQRVINAHCVNCHGADQRKADVDLRNFDALPSEAKLKIWRLVRTETMPPEDRDRLSEREILAFVPEEF